MIPDIISFETPNVRLFYEKNQYSLYDRTPSEKKVRLKIIYSPFSPNFQIGTAKKDLFYELLRSSEISDSKMFLDYSQTKVLPRIREERNMSNEFTNSNIHSCK